MNLIRSIIAFIILCGTSPQILSQNTPKYSFKAQIQEDNSISLNLKSINYNKGFLAILKVSNTNKKKESVLINDTILVSKGISKHTFEILDKFPTDDSILLINVLIKGIKSSHTFKKEITIQRNSIEEPFISINDSSLQIKLLKEKSTYLSILIKDLIDNSNQEKIYQTINKTFEISIRDLIESKPLNDRLIIIKLDSNLRNALDSCYYSKGELKRSPNGSNIFLDSIPQKKIPLLEYHGEAFLEHNSFSQNPFHSNGTLYPNHRIGLNSELDISQIPIDIDLNYNSNEGIENQFRNFYSIGINTDKLRDRYIQKLNRKEVKSILKTKKKLEILNEELKNLKSTKEILDNYPDELVKLDSSLINNLDSTILSRAPAIDTSIVEVDTLINDSIIDNEGSVYNDNLNTENIKKIEHRIQLINDSINFNDSILENSKPKSLNSKDFDWTSVPENEKLNLLYRFDELEFGNFYTYTGKYSIRDQEMIGLNITYKFDQFNSINIISSKTLKPRFVSTNSSFSNRIMSIGLKNDKHEFFQPQLRVSQFKELINEDELSSPNSIYYLLSINSNGSINELFDYDIELNKNIYENNSIVDNNNNNQIEDYALKGEVGYNILKNLRLGFQYDRVGKEFKSDGVFFLLRDTEIFGIKTNLKLFKNKISFKQNTLISKRNISEKKLDNTHRNFFFDVSTNFRRYPNIQIIYSPITYEIANNLDTSFNNFTINTTLKIVRISHVKKIKRTYLFSNLIFTEIDNSSDKQSFVQYNFIFQKTKYSFGFTNSYNYNERDLQFISLNGNIVIKNGYSLGATYSRNYQNSIYRSILRINASKRFLKSFDLTLGAQIQEFNDEWILGSNILLNYRF